MNTQAPVLYIPHGGGPLPLLGDDSHRGLIKFLKSLHKQLPKPEAIILISGHWEAAFPTLTSSANPELLFDYYGFPAAAYDINYPAPGSPALAQTIQTALNKAGIDAKLDAKRGYDHGFFVPLKLMFPNADIPCVQLSLIQGLDASQHIQLGACLSELRQQNIMIIGSGMSFHNMQALFAEDQTGMKAASDEFNQWLNRICTDSTLSAAQKKQALTNWQQAPYASFAHPREEHLIPLHVCFGAAASTDSSAKLIFNEELMGHKVSALLWN